MSFPLAVVGAAFQLFWRAFKQGWLALLLGLAITWLGMASNEASFFRIGVSLVILGTGLTFRMVLLTTSVRAEVRAEPDPGPERWLDLDEADGEESG